MRWRRACPARRPTPACECECEGAGSCGPAPGQPSRRAATSSTCATRWACCKRLPRIPRRLAHVQTAHAGRAADGPARPAGIVSRISRHCAPHGRPPCGARRDVSKTPVDACRRLSAWTRPRSSIAWHSRTYPQRSSSKAGCACSISWAWRWRAGRPPCRASPATMRSNSLALASCARAFSSAGAMTIDSCDGHDGHAKPKGHVGVTVLPAWLALADRRHDMPAMPAMGSREFLTALVLGYEIGTRAGIALHASACEYHTSVAWNALAAAALAARLLPLDIQQTREALGIAEYHGPRSQMMRCIDHPTMVKDGSGWGCMAGLSAGFLAQRGFTGAPALTLEQPAAQVYWD